MSQEQPVSGRLEDVPAGVGLVRVGWRSRKTGNLFRTEGGKSTREWDADRYEPVYRLVERDPCFCVYDARTAPLTRTPNPHCPREEHRG